MLLDAHTHLDLYEEGALAAALEEIARLGVLTVAMSIDPESYARTCAIAAREPLVLPCFGIHPWEAHRFGDGLAGLDGLIDASPLIGEIGLDYILDEDPAHYPAQRTVFAAFLRQAAAQDKIVNLHSKGAEHDVLAMLGQFGVRRAIVHWYSGPPDVFAAMAERGCYFTFGVAAIHDAHVRSLARLAPLDRILIETDGPGALRLFRDEVGMPHHLLEVHRALAEVRGQTAAEIQAAAAANWRRLVADDARLAPWATR